MNRPHTSLIRLITPLASLLLFILPTVPPTRAQGQTTAPLTNGDILNMVRAQLGDAVIVTKIKSSECKFDTSPDVLIKLKHAGLSDTILQAMAESGAVPRPASAGPSPGAALADPNDPLAEHDPGVYYLRQNRAGRQMVQLEPTAFSEMKSNNFFPMLWVPGTKMKQRGVVRGTRSEVRIAESRPTFYFYFQRKSGTPNYLPAWPVWFAALSGPNEFTLARLEAKKEERELLIGEIGMAKMSWGVRNEDTIKFDFEKLGPGLYKAIPRTDLQPGEYCFVYLGQGGMVRGGLFDFGVNPAE